VKTIGGVAVDFEIFYKCCVEQKLKSWLTWSGAWAFPTVLSRQGGCVKKLEGKGKVKDAKATKQLVALLSAPLEKYKDVVTILKLSNYGKVMEHLDYDTNRVMAVVLIQSILANNTSITAPEKVVLSVDTAFVNFQWYANTE
jgi:hypothetical protein